MALTMTDDIDPAKIVVYFDRRSDTLLIHLFGRGRESISVPVSDYLYVMVDPKTEVINGFHIEGFLSQAVKDIPDAIDLLDYAELRGITPAEVRELRREALGERHIRANLLATNGKSVPEQRKAAVEAVIGAERVRWGLSWTRAI
jgi:hypothetical protein